MRCVWRFISLRRWRRRKLEIFDNQAATQTDFRGCENGIFFNILGLGKQSVKILSELRIWHFFPVPDSSQKIRIGYHVLKLQFCPQYCWSKKEPNEGSYFVSCYITWGGSREHGTKRLFLDIPWDLGQVVKLLAGLPDFSNFPGFVILDLAFCIWS